MPPEGDASEATPDVLEQQLRTWATFTARRKTIRVRNRSGHGRESHHFRMTCGSRPKRLSKCAMPIALCQFPLTFVRLAIDQQLPAGGCDFVATR